MAKILLINPNKWGRGITTIWVASHAAVLKARGHEVRLFDATFYADWRHDEVKFNTENRQYRPTEWDQKIKLKQNAVRTDLQGTIQDFNPDLIFWSAISSHIHGEGEYVNIQYGDELMRSLEKRRAITVAGGLQPTARPEEMPEKFKATDYFIRGESELVLAELADRINDKQAFLSTSGLVYRDGGKIKINPPQPMISSFSEIPPYDYSLFEDQVFLRPYNGKVVRAVDYEMSRGCIYTCSYCVETVIQRYYGFTDNRNGTLVGATKYVRAKSAERIFDELSSLHKNYSIQLFRCQDTNFLTIPREVLEELAERLSRSHLNIQLYVETRPDGINEKSVALLKKLKVDGVGMGLEISSDGFRKNLLNRFSPEEKIIEAFQLLRQAGIRRSAYNIIGLPEQDEEMIHQTIRFNRMIDPDNITVAFYSPYIGTEQQRKATEQDYFEGYEFDVDGQLRTVCKSSKVDPQLLLFYKKNFVRLAREGIEQLQHLKIAEGLT